MSNSLPEERRFCTSGFEPDVIIGELVGGWICCGASLGCARRRKMPLRPEGAAAATHIIGYKLLIRLLPKLDLTSIPCSNAAAQRCVALSRFEVHGNFITLPAPRREDLKDLFRVSSEFVREFHLLS